MRYLILILVVLSSCSLEKRLYSKQRKVNKLEFEIHEIKKELNLPLDSVIFSSDTILIEKRIVKRDTIKTKCDSFGNVIINDTIVKDGDIVFETEYIDRERIVENEVLKVKKEIIYKDREIPNKEKVLMAFGLVAIILLLLYSFGKFTGLLIRMFNLKNI
jgi:hypothetical protein